MKPCLLGQALGTEEFLWRVFSKPTNDLWRNVYFKHLESNTYTTVNQQRIFSSFWTSLPAPVEEPEEAQAQVEKSKLEMPTTLT